jgi:hypothetical protein
MFNACGPDLSRWFVVYLPRQPPVPCGAAVAAGYLGP